METKRWKIDEKNPQPAVIQTAAEIIRTGGLVAFPTETVYGLGANGLDKEAVKRIFQAKGRPGDNPLILHISETAAVDELASRVSSQARLLMRLFWPGPLTLVLPRREHIPREVTAGLDTVAIRMPSHPVARALIQASGVPIAAPSANRSGLPSPTMAQHVWDDLQGRIEAVLDGGPTGVGLESTVVDLSGEKPAILRPGGVTREQLAAALGAIEVDPGIVDPNIVPKAPGMKYTHYSPRADVVLIDGKPERVARKLGELLEQQEKKGRKVALLLTEETWSSLGQAQVTYAYNLGSRRNLSAIAQTIYRELRNCDLAGADIIFTETYAEENIGAALMNRLLKAAGYTMIKT